MIELAPQSDFMTYEEAVLYCMFCTHNGHSDWRLPTYAEWKDADMLGWFVDRLILTRKLMVVPVRDVC